MSIDVTSEATHAALLALAAQTRELMDAVLATGADDDELAAVTEELRALTARLDAARRPPVEFGEPRWLLGNAAVGAANPFAPPVEVEYPPGGGVRAEQVFRPLHEGPPGLVHGGVSAMVLDHLLGTAVGVAGRVGLTASLTMSYRAPVPLGGPRRGDGGVHPVGGPQVLGGGPHRPPRRNRPGGGHRSLHHPGLAPAGGLTGRRAAWPSGVGGGLGGRGAGGAVHGHLADLRPVRRRGFRHRHQGQVGAVAARHLAEVAAGPAGVVGAAGQGCGSRRRPRATRRRRRAAGTTAAAGRCPDRRR
ncbi:PaaI family thioesterase [Nonomuraea ferruginea]